MAVTISGSGQVIVQVIQTVKSDTFSTTSTSFVDITGLTANITPTSASNKILVQVVLGATASSTNVASTLLLRNSTTIGAGDGANGVLGQIYFGGASEGAYYFGNVPSCVTYLDSPATTSSTTYKCQVRENLNFNRSYDISAGSSPSSITLLEIAA